MEFTDQTDDGHPFDVEIELGDTITLPTGQTGHVSWLEGDRVGIQVDETEYIVPAEMVTGATATA